MSDPGIMHSTHLSGAHFRVGKPDPSEGFPEGTQFRSPLLLANVGATPITAHVSADLTVRARDKDEEKKSQTNTKTQSDDSVNFTTVALKDVMITPGDVQLVELSEAINGNDISGPIDEAGVDVDYDGPAGSLIGQLTSVDQTGDYAFEVPVKDPHAMNETLSGVYPWTVEGGSDTTLHLKNTTNQPVTALVLITYPGGTYQPSAKRLEPYQTVAIDVQQLKDSQKPDVAGHVFPPEADQGQIAWYQKIPYSMIGRAEQTTLQSGIARSFSCPNTCCDNWNVSYYLYPGDVAGVPGTTATEYIDDYGVACGGYCFNMTNNGSCNWVSTNTSSGAAVSWSSDDSSVSSVDSGGTVTFQSSGGGTTNINGAFHEPSYDYGGDGFCHDDGGTTTYSAQAAVCDFDISPKATTATYCDSLHANSVNFNATNIPSACTWLTSTSSCTQSGDGGNINGTSGTDNITNISVSCNAQYYAGGPGTLTFSMTVDFGTHGGTVTHSVGDAISCP